MVVSVVDPDPRGSVNVIKIWNNVSDPDPCQRKVFLLF